MGKNAEEVRESMDGIAALTEESSASAEEASASTEELSAQVEEVVASASTLADLANSLKESVSVFKVEDSNESSNTAAPANEASAEFDSSDEQIAA